MLGGLVPEGVSTFAPDLDFLFKLILYVVGSWFIVVEGLILYSAIRFRRGASPRAQYVKGETWRQLRWVLIPAAIVFALDIAMDAGADPAWARQKIDIPEKGDVNVVVTGKQFNWMFTYPGPSGKLEGADAITEPNDLHVPVNKVVRITIKSQDVIHSFFVPALRVKQDAEPGHSIPQWFQATKTGTYEIACVELCGFGHYTMRGRVIVQSEQDYQKWLAEELKEAHPAK